MIGKSKQRPPKQSKSIGQAFKRNTVESGMVAGLSGFLAALKSGKRVRTLGSVEKSSHSDPKFRNAVQKRVAQVAIGASTLRGSKRSTVGIVRSYLAELELDRFARASRFSAELDATTSELTRRAAIRWGTARKCLNIFLRDAAYNYFLRKHHRLAGIAGHLELPLDSKTAKELHARQREAGKLPRWLGVKYLKPKESQEYQRLAKQVADLEGVDRVDLDNDYWPSVGKPRTTAR